jgi:hypothetical protein
MVVCGEITLNQFTGYFEYEENREPWYTYRIMYYLDVQNSFPTAQLWGNSIEMVSGFLIHEKKRLER